MTLLAGLVNLGGLGGCGDPADSLEALKAQRAQLDATVWADETLAQEYEQTLVSVWDALLGAGRRRDHAGKAAVLSSIDFEELRVSTPRRCISGWAERPASSRSRFVG